MNKNLIFNVYKKAGESSYDVLRKIKKKSEFKINKIGHFGTLDPFADGVLLVALGPASRLNNFVHDQLPKTYLAKGLLGAHTATGDLTSAISNEDKTDYFNNVISSFSANFIEQQLRDKFLGQYLQSPHQYSAAKFEGKKLYEWAREGVVIKKEAVAREIYKIEVVSYKFPYLEIRFQVSSGTYIRTLFSDCANHLGTLGVLEKLTRQSVGSIDQETSVILDNFNTLSDQIFDQKKINFDEILPFPKIIFDEQQRFKFVSGQRISLSKVGQIIEEQLYWCLDENQNYLGLGKKVEHYFKSVLTFSS